MAFKYMKGNYQRTVINYSLWPQGTWQEATVVNFNKRNLD